MENKRMRFVTESGGLKYYLFTPSVFSLYFNEHIERIEPEHRYTKTHELKMLFYLIFCGGYKILYAVDPDDLMIASYFIFMRSRDFLLEGSGKKDFYTVFYYTYPEYRNRGIGTKLSNIVLNGLNLEYRYFYKTIHQSNKSSIKVAEKVGFTFDGYVKKSGKLHRLFRTEKSPHLLYIYDKNNG